ncbi:MAG: class I SAM-dependent methyltransferase [Bacillota bacterium]
MALIDQVRRAAIARAVETEQLPPLIGPRSDAELSSFRYPFERGLSGYIQKLPDLQALLPHARRILDIGAGRGLALAEIQEQYLCEVVATGITQAQDALVPLTLCTAVELPFPDQSFDLVVSVQSISWEPDQRAAIREATRVLTPGGVGLHFLTTFSYSVAHRYGEAFWEEIGIDRQDYVPYEFAPDIDVTGARVMVNPVEMKHPYGEHHLAYYVKVVRE